MKLLSEMPEWCRQNMLSAEETGAERIDMKKRVVTAIFVAMLGMGITGCGENAIPSLTEEELQEIGEYTAVTLMKYDANRRSRLVDLQEKTVETPEMDAATEPPEESGIPETDAEEIENTAVIDKTEEFTASSAEEILGLPDGLRISFVEAEVCDSYPNDGEDNYFMLKATEERQLLVLHFQLNNETDQEMTVDIASGNTEFRLTVNENYKRTVLPTLLPDDLSTYIGSVPANGSIDTALVIEVEQQCIEEVTSVFLKLKNDTKTYTIQLF